MPGDALAALNPEIGELQILNTSSTGIQIRAAVNVTNPTPYTASIPFISIRLMKGEYVMGKAIAKDLEFGHGQNKNIMIEMTWDPASFGGDRGHEVGRRLLSEYLSGKNTTMTLKAHKHSIPTMPVFGEALSRLNITLPAPRLKLPGDDGSEGRGFIRDATFHVFSSTATFTLASPLGYDTVHVEYINATAFYNHTEPIGQITYDQTIHVPPGLSQTPYLPVEWSADHVGFDKLRDALGGNLKLDAVADVSVRVGSWTEDIHYTGKGIGAKVSF